MKRMRMRATAFLLCLILLAIGFAAQVMAQTRPTTTPTYTPQGALAAQTISASGGTAPFLINGDGELYFRIAGACTGLTAVPQISEFRSGGTLAWTNTGVIQAGVARTATITGIGLYRLPVAGLAQVRLNVTAITGSCTLTMIAGAGVQDIGTLPITRTTYSASIKALAPAASATDFFTLTGSATTTVRITKVRCTGLATATASNQVLGLIRSTADTAGTATNPAGVPHDSNNPAATAVVAAYTANPTLGTLVGQIKAQYLGLDIAATTSIGMPPLEWSFGFLPGEQEIVLRGAAQQFALNGNAASFAAGAAIDCNVDWTEE